MIDKSIAICILARDCRERLTINIPKVEELRTAFSKSYVIIVENDSVDGTKELLEKWHRTSTNIIILSEDTGTVTIPKENKGNFINNTRFERIDKMAKYRNKYMEYIHSNLSFIDYVIVLDIDVYDFPSHDVVLDVFNKSPDNWSSLTANGNLFVSPKRESHLYYDTFAYVPLESDTYDITFRDRYLNANKLCKLLRKNDFVPCKSAFAGFGIYKYEYLHNVFYSTEKNRVSKMMEVLCEHISIYKEITKFAPCYVCKDLKVLYKPIKKKGEWISYLFGYKVFIMIWELIKHKKLI